MYSNELTVRGLVRHEGKNYCSRCYEEKFDPRVRTSVKWGGEGVAIWCGLD